MFKTHSATSIIPNEAFTSALGVLLLFIASWLMGCRAERFYNEKNTLAFSQDTVWFDTVFTRKPGSTYPISVTKIGIAIGVQLKVIILRCLIVLPGIVMQQESIIIIIIIVIIVWEPKAILIRLEQLELFKT